MEDELVRQALEVRKRAHAPYSNFKVGAALLGKSGKIYTGCNVENASYGLSVCAERNAVYKAVSEGEKEFVALAVATENGVAPCGACRQVLTEFVSSPEKFTIILVNSREERRRLTLKELFPEAFAPSQLK